MDVKPVLLNVANPIDVTELGMIMDVKLVHPANAYWLIVSSCEFSSNVTDVNAEQDSNANSSINVTDAGIVMDVNFPIFLNRFLRIDVKFFGNITDDKFEHPWNKEFNDVIFEHSSSETNIKFEQ